MNQDQSMKLISVKLEEFEMSAENNTIANGRTWVHLQNRKMASGDPWRIFDL